MQLPIGKQDGSVFPLAASCTARPPGSFMDNLGIHSRVMYRSKSFANGKNFIYSEIPNVHLMQKRAIIVFRLSIRLLCGIKHDDHTHLCFHCSPAGNLTLAYHWAYAVCRSGTTTSRLSFPCCMFCRIRLVCRGSFILVLLRGACACRAVVSYGLLWDSIMEPGPILQYPTLSASTVVLL